SKAGIPLRGDLLITGVVGELQGGVGAYDLVQRGIGADYTIICEPSGTDVRTIHAGAIQMVINVTGSSAWVGALHHASPVNAVEKMMKVIEALRTVAFSATRRDDLVGLPRLIVGGINGGIGHGYAKWRASYVPDYCSIIVEVRGLPGQDWEEARQDIERAIAPVAAQDPELRYEIGMPPATYSPEWRSMKVPAYGIDVPTAHNLPQTVRRRHVQVVGKEPARVGFQDPGSYAWTDAGHFALGGSIPVIYGPSSNLEHGAPIDNVVNVARVLALAAAEICTRAV
ncbi:MAG: peptidase dimerization domain-containing protein, partial [Chloroflexi bacterium]|nr:peptidase dimerization domain-containing protein [Chloroflexota bacterium]